MSKNCDRVGETYFMQSENTKLGQDFRNKLSPVKTLFELIEVFLNTEERMRSSVVGNIRSINNTSRRALADLKWISAEASHLPLQQKLCELDPIMDKFQEFLSEIDDSVRLGRAKALKKALESNPLISDTIALAEHEEED